MSEQESPGKPQPSTDPGRQISRIDSERFFFLDRMARLQGIPPDPGRPEEVNKLIRKAVFSTYGDCLSIGIGEEARQIIRGEQTSYLGIVVFESEKKPEPQTR